MKGETTATNIETSELKFGAVVKKLAVAPGKTQVVLEMTTGRASAKLLPDLSLWTDKGVEVTLHRDVLPRMNDDVKDSVSDPSLFDDDDEHEYTSVDTGEPTPENPEHEEAEREMEIAVLMKASDMPVGGKLLKADLDIPDSWSTMQKQEAINANVCTIVSRIWDDEEDGATIEAGNGVKLYMNLDDLNAGWKPLLDALVVSPGDILGFVRGSGTVSQYRLESLDEVDRLIMRPINAPTDTQTAPPVSWTELQVNPWYKVIGIAPQEAAEEAEAGDDEGETADEVQLVEDPQSTESATESPETVSDVEESVSPEVADAPYGYVVIRLSSSGQQEKIIECLSTKDAAEARVETFKGALSDRYAFRVATEDEQKKRKGSAPQVVEKGSVIEDPDEQRWRVYQVSPVIYLKHLYDPEQKKTYDREGFLAMFPGYALPEEGAE